MSQSDAANNAMVFFLSGKAHPELNYEYGRKIMDGLLDADVAAERLTHEQAQSFKDEVRWPLLRCSVSAHEKTGDTEGRLERANLERDRPSATFFLRHDSSLRDSSLGRRIIGLMMRRNVGHLVHFFYWRNCAHVSTLAG